LAILERYYPEATTSPAGTTAGASEFGRGER